MKKLLSFILILFCVTMVQASDVLSENFETGLPSSPSTSETQASLASGIWLTKDVYGKNDNGSKRATMSSNAYLITPVLPQPGRVSFKHRASGSGKKLKVEKSVDGGNTWTEIGTATVSS